MRGRRWVRLVVQATTSLSMHPIGVNGLLRLVEVPYGIYSKRSAPTLWGYRPDVDHAEGSPGLPSQR